MQVQIPIQYRLDDKDCDKDGKDGKDGKDDKEEKAG